MATSAGSNARTFGNSFASSSVVSISGAPRPVDDGAGRKKRSDTYTQRGKYTRTVTEKAHDNLGTNARDVAVDWPVAR